MELKKHSGKTQRHLNYWLDYFTIGKVLEDAPEYIKEACYIVEYQNLDKEERAMVDATEKAHEDLKATIIYAQKESREEIAKKMLKKGLTIKLIHEVTGLDVKEIEKLK
ncbi:hypothetical protein [Enterococcus plantarum]|uniref:hypothetical protein n=1 Tax=Enterococcus plantarum TaxID=1077675 RepID=UPI001A9079D6|nr:hypothetical protein [Enterococcus plantarum]MBO0422315.1 hypothetical protein [Enterococcus plantarum]